MLVSTPHPSPLPEGEGVASGESGGVKLDDVAVTELVMVGDADGGGVGGPADGVLESLAHLVVDRVGQILTPELRAQLQGAGGALIGEPVG